MRTEDGNIIRECINGDSASFGLLVDKYKASIFALYPPFPKFSRVGFLYKTLEI